MQKCSESACNRGLKAQLQPLLRRINGFNRKFPLSISATISFLEIGEASASFQSWNTGTYSRERKACGTICPLEVPQFTCKGAGSGTLLPYFTFAKALAQNTGSFK
jgi:hypothetical protein